MKAILLAMLMWPLTSNCQVPFDIGTKWTYEVENWLLNTKEFYTYELTDTATIAGEKVWVVNTIDDDIMLKQEDNKVWLYREELADFQLTYDFGATADIPFEWAGVCPPVIYEGDTIHKAKMHIDSIRQTTLPSGIQTSSQFISYDESTLEETYNSHGREAIKGIGFRNRGLDLNTGYFICSRHTFAITQLRCFENDTMQLNFVGYDCDSIWQITNVEEFDEGSLSLYPNPNSGTVHIDGIENESEYRIYDLTGKLLQNGVTVQNMAYIYHSGAAIIRIKVGDSWLTKKVITIR